ncbi:MAG: hypothetical protein JSS56_16785 [Proteobacteria bacterium]|nr:hypothetical protein [Pseudomonadota bacterium]
MDAFFAAPAGAGVSTNPESYEPLLISQNLRRLSELCDRCLSLRKEIRELEVLAVKAATDYELFLATSAIDENLEKLRLNQQAKIAAEAGFRQASAVFGRKDEVTRGLSGTLASKAQELELELQSADEISKLLGDRWSAVRKFQAAYFSRTQDLGNAHNFAERAEKLGAILRQCLLEAGDRAKSVYAGLLIVYGRKATLPTIDGSLESIDALVIWTLEAQRRLSRSTESESSFDLVVPLVQPWLSGGGSLIAAKDFDRAIADHPGRPIKLGFEIPRDVFFGQKVRLKGFGIAYGNSYVLVSQSGIDSAQTADSFVRMAAKVSTPEQFSADGQPYRRPDLFFGNIGLHHSSQPMAYVDGPAVENLDPSGRWEILVHPWLVWKDESSRLVSDGIYQRSMKDLKLFMRLYLPRADVMTP